MLTLYAERLPKRLAASGAWPLPRHPRPDECRAKRRHRLEARAMFTSAVPDASGGSR